MFEVRGEREGLVRLKRHKKPVPIHSLDQSSAAATTLAIEPRTRPSCNVRGTLLPLHFCSASSHAAVSSIMQVLAGWTFQVKI
jgi:hypothetical protein